MLVVFIGAGCEKNSAPDRPQVSGPGAAKPGATLTYGFTSTDANGDDVYYMVSWGDGTAADWSSARPSGEQLALTHVYPDSGVYFIKAKARDSDQAESDWSDSVRVAIGYVAPNQPLRPSGPSACTTKASGVYSVKAVHPLDDSVSFQFYWGDQLGDWGPMVASGRTYQASHVFDTIGTYMIAARARDGRGLESAWSDSLRVVVRSSGGTQHAPYNVTLAAATDSTVRVEWLAPADTTPDRYVIAFKAVGSIGFDSVGTTQTRLFVHDPAGQTGEYEVIAVFGEDRYASAENTSTTPVATDPWVVSELNGTSLAGYGWDRTSGEGSLHHMASADTAPVVDFYVTDFAPGYAGPDYWVASPFLAPNDPGGGAPPANWNITEFTYLDSLATENDPLPRYSQSRYLDRRVIGWDLPRLIAGYTEDGHFALLNVMAADTVDGTVTVNTWFQTVPYLRLIQH